MIITSSSNDFVRYALCLQEKKRRDEFRQFVVEGVRACQTFIDCGMEPVHLFITKDFLPRFDGKQRGIIVVSESVMQKMSGQKTPSGALAVFNIPPQPSLNKLSAGLVLAKLNDPGNMGTLIRTAAALNMRTIVVLEGSADPWGPKTVQASAGMLAAVHIFSWTWQELLQNKGDLDLCALVVSGGKYPWEVTLKKSLLIVGNEAHGIPSEWQRACTHFMTIPMPGGTESLNAAVAGSLALYLAQMNGFASSVQENLDPF